jgi:hypothetical protein
MPLVLANRVQETGTANTTVSFTLTGAVPGFQSFATIGNTNTTYYSATDGSSNWEVGLGTYSTTGPTLTRTTIYASSNAGSAVTFSGVVNVFVTYPSGRSVNLDASGNVSALGTVASGTWQGSTIGVAYGGTGVTTSSGPNSVVLRDANDNISVNRLNQGLQNTTASGGVTILTAASDFNQLLTGTGNHTFRLPDATTLTDTTAFQFNNAATGTLTIQNNATGVIGTVTTGGAANAVLISNATVAGTWEIHGYLPEGVTWGTNALALGTTVISGGTWQGGTIQSGYGGTGLTTFAGANNALYSTSASALAAGTLPIAAGGTGTATPSLVAGTNVTISGSFPNQTINASGGGLTQFTAAESTTAPNATVYVDSLTAAASSTNADVAFVAKGSGATLAQVPTATAAGGNKRGTGATDWQKGRSTATQVASGSFSSIAGGYANTNDGIYSSLGGGLSNIITQDYATIAGGGNNTASGANSAVVGGNSNTGSSPYAFVGGGFTNKAQTAATGYNVVVGGANNIASGNYSFVGGGGDATTATDRNTASGINSAVVGGGSNTASNDFSVVSGGKGNLASGAYSLVLGGLNCSATNTYAIAAGIASTASGNRDIAIGGDNVASGGSSLAIGGQINTASGVASSVIGGYRGLARSISGTVVFPASAIPLANANGVSQMAFFILARQTTDATATTLASNTSAATTTNQVILPNNSAYYVKGSIIATVTGGGDTKSWDFIATIKRGANAAATSIVGAVTLNVQAADAGAATWIVAITADTTNGGLAVTVTGQAATTIRWVAKLESTEVTF